MILAQTPESWTDPEPMPWLETLGIFVGVPAAMFLLIILAVLAPSMIKGAGYRPGLSWWAPPQWFGTPPEESVQAEADPATQSAAGTTERSGERSVTGGVGARW